MRTAISRNQRGDGPEVGTITSTNLVREVELTELKEALGPTAARKLATLYNKLEKNGINVRSTEGIFSEDAKPIIDAANLTPRQLEGLKLFNSFYRSASECFPDPDELENPKALLKYLSDSEDPLRLVLLTKKGSSEVIGGIHFQSLETEHGFKFAVAENAWSPAVARESGYGQVVLDKGLELAQTIGVHAVVAEFNDVHVMSKSEKQADIDLGIHPMVRAFLYGRFRLKKFDAPYIQPALDQKSSPVYYLGAMIRFLGDNPPEVKQDEKGSYVTKEFYLSVLRAMHDYNCEGPDAVRATKTYKRIEHELRNVENIYLIHPADKREHPQIRRVKDSPGAGPRKEWIEVGAERNRSDSMR